MRAVRVTTGLTCGALLVGCLVGCQVGESRDKVGNRTRILRLATIDAVNETGIAHGPQEFVEALEDVSGGRLRVEVDRTTFGGGGADAESRLVAAIASGDVDGGLPATRAFAAAGVSGLESVEAPLVLTSYDAVRELVDSPTATTLLERLDGSGVTGLALAVGSLRRPFGASPLLGPEDWEGARFRSYNSRVQDAAIAAWGGTPVHVGFEWTRQVAEGRLEGIEFDVAQYYANGATVEVGDLTGNVVLWPKVFVLSLGEALYDDLTPQERSWVDEAADRARRASVTGPYDEARIVELLCRDGMEVHLASPRQVSDLREAITPVLDDLADDPVLAELRAIARRHPEVDSFDPATCVPAPIIEQAVIDTVPAGDSGIPDGIYRTRLTPEHLAGTGIGPRVDGWAGTWTMTIRDGTYSIDCTPLSGASGNDCNFASRLPDGFDFNPREVGRVTGRGDTAWFVHDPALEAAQTDCTWPERASDPEPCYPRVVSEVTWRYGDGALVIFDLRTNLEPSIDLIAAPWTRIG